MPYSRPLRVRVSEELYQKLEREAKEKGLRISDVVRSILEQHFKKKPAEEIVEALAKTLLEDPELKELLVKGLKSEKK